MRENITILALSWRDIRAPKAGGAEKHTHEMLKRGAEYGFKIIHISPMFEGAAEKERLDGVTYIRHGNIATVIAFAERFYHRYKNRIDLVIDQCNTHSFFTPLWVAKEKRIFYIHQLTREIWDIQAKPPLSFIGKRMETPILKTHIDDRAVITVSESTKKDLVDLGFDSDRIHIIPNALDHPVWDEKVFLKKEDAPTFIYAGRFVHYKGIDDAISALGILKQSVKNAKLWCIGKRDDEYINTVLHPLAQKYGLKEISVLDDNTEDLEDADIIYFGFVSEERKLELMSRSWALLFPSMREGWGIIVLEAASVGTPSIVYDNPGCRDAVDFGKAGYLCLENSPEDLARLMKVSIDNSSEYDKMQKAAYEFVRSFSWDESGRCFIDLVNSLKKRNN